MAVCEPCPCQQQPPVRSRSNGKPMTPRGVFRKAEWLPALWNGRGLGGTGRVRVAWRPETQADHFEGTSTLKPPFLPSFTKASPKSSLNGFQ